MKKKILGITILTGFFLITGALVFMFTQSQSDNQMTGSTLQDTSVATPQSENTPENATEQDTIAYAAYSPELVANASADDKIVLFFHAQWCSTCNMLDNDIVSNQQNIPSNTRILKVDFDSATDLKQKYEVRTQHTLVQVNNQGEAQDTWAQSFTLDSILGRIN